MGWAEEKADGKPVTAKAIREAAVEVMEVSRKRRKKRIRKKWPAKPSAAGQTPWADSLAARRPWTTTAASGPASRPTLRWRP